MGLLWWLHAPPYANIALTDDFESLGTQECPVGGCSFNWDNINQGWRHILVLGNGTEESTGGAHDLAAILNTDNSADQVRERIEAGGATFSASAITTAKAQIEGAVMGTATPVQFLSGFAFFIFNYPSAIFKPSNGMSATQSAGLHATIADWDSTNAVTRLQLYANDAPIEFDQYARATAYILK